jgi:hypothetical protein
MPITLAMAKMGTSSRPVKNNSVGTVRAKGMQIDHRTCKEPFSQHRKDGRYVYLFKPDQEEQKEYPYLYEQRNFFYRVHP